MKTIFSSMKHSYLARIGILLIVVALVAGILSCNGVVTYELVIDSTAGGVTTPAEGTHTYDARTVVDLVATPDCGYVFVNWTGDTGQIDDVNAAATNITMSADYPITANFKPIPPDHYKFYDVDYEEEPVYIGAEVLLEDQFGTFNATVMEAVLFGNPVEKDHPGMPLTPISDDNRHYTVYWLDFNEEDWVRRSVEISNQFNDAAEPQTLTVLGPVALAVPTKKEDHEMVECLNHYLLYWVEEYPEFPEVVVNLKDQFIEEDVTVWEPFLFANPVQKTVVENGDVAVIEDEDLHWVLYDIEDIGFDESINKRIQIANQFGNDQTLDLTYRHFLAVPSEKNVPPTPPLDHFKCYQTVPEEPLNLEVGLLDQFHSDYLSAVVGPSMMFCNPVDKVHGTVTTTSNPDNHLTVYWIETLKGSWSVTVHNQFGDDQELTVWGPVALAVPTQKLEPGDHGMPKYVDHYLLYEVVEGLNVTATVDLDDQFPEAAPDVKVTQPVYFATPAIKGYLDYEPGFWDPEEHLVFYRISDNGEYYEPPVLVRNQFFSGDAVPLYLIPIDQLLAVPSVKVDWEPLPD